MLNEQADCSPIDWTLVALLKQPEEVERKGEALTKEQKFIAQERTISPKMQSLTPEPKSLSGNQQGTQLYSGLPRFKTMPSEAFNAASPERPTFLNLFYGEVTLEKSLSVGMAKERDSLSQSPFAPRRAQMAPTNVKRRFESARCGAFDKPAVRERSPIGSAAQPRVPQTSKRSDLNLLERIAAQVMKREQKQRRSLWRALGGPER